ncbi:hypothetical protein DL765_008517 [Monosporascus sp. GIB2]|nr:hypothetical protein DL765_008517 [Monosporascus sp. GIB2]
MLHTRLDRLFWNPLMAPDSPYRELWKGRTNADGFHKLPLVQDIGLAEGMADWNFRDKIREMTDYLAHMFVADRTGNLLDASTGWNGREFFENKVFMMEGIYNGVLGAIRTNFDGHKQAELFTAPLEESDTEKRQAAEDFVIEMLEKSHMYKVCHISADGLPALGDLVKNEGFRDVDHRLGTFDETYRYGTVHWESTREVERLTRQPTGEELIRATPTEPARRES